MLCFQDGRSLEICSLNQSEINPGVLTKLGQYSNETVLSHRPLEHINHDVPEESGTTLEREKILTASTYVMAVCALSGWEFSRQPPPAAAVSREMDGSGTATFVQAPGQRRTWMEEVEMGQ